MASGVEMMLKALGIDPEEIKKSMLGTVQAVMDGITSLKLRLDTIDNRLSRIEDEMGIEREINGQHVVLAPERKQAKS